MAESRGPDMIGSELLSWIFGDACFVDCKLHLISSIMSEASDAGHVHNPCEQWELAMCGRGD